MGALQWFAKRITHKRPQSQTNQQSAKLLVDSSVTPPKKKSTLGGLVDSTFKSTVKIIRKDPGFVSGAGPSVQKEALAAPDHPSTKEHSIPDGTIDASSIKTPQCDRLVSPPSALLSPVNEPLLEVTASTEIPDLPALIPFATLAYEIEQGSEDSEATATVIPTTELSTTNLSVPEPHVTEPQITELQVTETVLTESMVFPPLVVEPLVTEPLVTEPLVTELSAREPASNSFVQEEASARNQNEITAKFLSSVSSEVKETAQDSALHPIWGSTPHISDENLEKLAMEHAPSGAEKAVVAGCKAGMHNRVVFIGYQPTKEKRCIRIPASGWEGRWSNTDKFQLTRSNHIMIYLKKHTSIPIPEIFHWDTELDNTIRAPYTIMNFMDGLAPLPIWLGDVYAKTSTPDDSDVDEGEEDRELVVDTEEEDEAEAGKKEGGDENLKCARSVLNFHAGFHFNKVSPGLENKRQNILKSLASSVAELRHLKFDKLGSISFPQGADGPPEIVPSIFLPYGVGRETAPDPNEFRRDRTFDSTFGYLHYRLDQVQRDIGEDDNLEPSQEDLLYGMETLYRIVINCLPLQQYHESPDETFVIAPPDFGSQNILCDEEGNVTALLDWDTVDTKPRPIGWCLAPDWLCIDWWGEDRYCWPNSALSPQEIEAYRLDYARYLQEACGDDTDYEDWKLTTKSAMYEVTIDALSCRDEDRMLKALKAMLATFLPRMNHIELIRQIGGQEGDGMGPEMTTYFYAQFEKLFGTEGKNAASSTSAMSESEATARPSSAQLDEESTIQNTDEHDSKNRMSNVSGKLQDPDQRDVAGMRDEDVVSVAPKL